MIRSEPDPRLSSSKLHADIERLRAQVALSWPHELEVLQRLGLADGQSILDIGCGPGFVTEKLGETFPTSPIVAADLDPAMTALVAARLGPRSRGRLRVINSSVLQLNLDDACIDFALARFVLQHLPAPELALAEVFRLVRPGGRLAVVDVDDALGGIVDPPIAGLEAMSHKVAQLQANRGGNRFVGRRLWSMLAQSGFERLAIDPILIHSDELGIERFLPQFDPDRYRRFIAADGLTEDDVTSYQHGLAKFLGSPRPYIAHLLLVVSGRKPLTG